MKGYDPSPNTQAAAGATPGTNPWRSSNSFPGQTATTATNGTTASKLK